MNKPKRTSGKISDKISSKVFTPKELLAKKCTEVYHLKNNRNGTHRKQMKGKGKNKKNLQKSKLKGYLGTNYSGKPQTFFLLDY